MQKNSSSKLPPDTEVIEKCASSIEKPADRLRFLQKATAAHNEMAESVRSSSSPVSTLFESRFLRWVVDGKAYREIVDDLLRMRPENREQWRAVWQKAPWRVRVFFHLYQSRYLVYSCALVLVIGGLVGATAVARRNVKLRVSDHTTQPGTVSATRVQRDEATSQAWPSQEERVWLVEKTAEFERYSNGGRILTKFEIENHARSFVALSADGRVESSSRGQTASLPIGIVYHSSESDIIPFTSDNSESIQAHSEGLASYVRRNRSYNYLIDRYGEIYRIVRDDHAANHAGYSVWGDGKQVYIGLNESFIGICFESSSVDDENTSSESESARGSQLTEAQISSGRALTGILRSRYQIADVNCTTHGLVSVDPQRGTIAHHHDWVRGFPFSAFNLSDKYTIAPVSVALFGFDADDEVLEKLGNKLWQGALKARDEVAARAEHEGVAVGEWRRRQRELFTRGQEVIWSLRRTLPSATPGIATDLGDTKDALRSSGQ